MTTRPADELPELPEVYTDNLGVPYGGLFGNSVLAHIVEEMIADPAHQYTPTELQELIGASMPRIREGLKVLVSLRLIENRSGNKKRPKYSVRPDQERVTALTLLSYAITDDIDGSETMNYAIKTYCESELNTENLSLAEADNPDYRVVSTAATVRYSGFILGSARC